MYATSPLGSTCLDAAIFPTQAACGQGRRPAIVCVLRSSASLPRQLRSRAVSRRGVLYIRSSATHAADAGDAVSGLQHQHREAGLLAAVRRRLSPFDDPVANARVLALCFSQMLCSMATLIHDTYLPVYLSEELHLTNTQVGNLHAFAQLASNAAKVASGVAADLILPPARLVVLGTALTCINKPVFALACWAGAAFGPMAALRLVAIGKLVDRVSKGVREAPTKALIGQMAAAAGDRADAAFSLRQSLATTGALLGANAAALVYGLSGRRFGATFAAALVPSLIALMLVVVAFSGPDDVTRRKDRSSSGSGITTNGRTKVVLPPSTHDPPRTASGSSSSGSGIADSSSGSSNDIGDSSSSSGSSSSGSGSGGNDNSSANDNSSGSSSSSSSGVCAGAGDGGGGPAATLSPLRRARLLLGALRPGYWQALCVVGLTYLARFDVSFVTLRAKAVVPRSELPLLVSMVMLTQALLAAPAGLRAKAGAGPRNQMLLLGCFALVGANAAYGLLGSRAGLALGSVLAGVHLATSHGVSQAMLSRYMPHTPVPGLGRASGTAWSLTDMILGITLAAANSIAGVLADMTASRGLGPVGCFGGGAVAALAATAALLLFSDKRFGELGVDCDDGHASDAVNSGGSVSSSNAGGDGASSHGGGGGSSVGGSGGG